MEVALRRNTLMRVRRFHELVVRRRLALALVGEPRPDDRRVDELVGAVGRHEQLGVFELDLDRVTGEDVGHVHREHVGTALLEERGALSFALRRVEVVLRLLTFLDRRHDAHVAHGHRHAVDRGARRRRKHVAGVQRPLAAILVDLPHGDVGDHAGNRDVDARVLERQAIDGRIAAVDEK
jgi:hypothetical protein